MTFKCFGVDKGISGLGKRCRAKTDTAAQYWTAAPCLPFRLYGLTNHCRRTEFLSDCNHSGENRHAGSDRDPLPGGLNR
ncbi:MAG: hypothetical protein AAFS13_10270, partial [Pseudomonadota bacterium]